MTIAEFLNAFDCEIIVIRDVFICRHGYWANEVPENRVAAGVESLSLRELFNNDDLLNLTIQRWTIEEYYDDGAVKLGFCTIN